MADLTDSAQRHPVLLSYWYFKDVDLDAWLDDYVGSGAIVIADSGGFTADTQGVHIEVDDYVAWCRRWGHRLTAAFTLDDVGNAQVTWDNTRRLHDAGVSVLPIFHTAEEWSWLDRYVEAGYPYIGLGGMVGRPRPSVNRFLAYARRIIPPTTAVHALGIGQGKVLSGMPWYSADSSLYLTLQKYGRISMWDPYTFSWWTVVFRGGVRSDAWRRHVVTNERMGRLLAYYGLDPAVVANPGRFGVGDVTIATTLGYASTRACEASLRARFGDQHRTDLPGLPGLLLYSVMGTSSNPKLYEYVRTLRP